MTAHSRFAETMASVRRWLGLSPDPRRPSRALFGGIRRRLTLWYTVVMAGALILSGTVLYFEVQQNLLGPMNSELAGQAQTASEIWQHNYIELQQNPFLGNSCPSAGYSLDPSLLIVCYGSMPESSGTDIQPGLRKDMSGFTGRGLARSVVGGGSAGDTVTTSLTGEFASIQRYALAVPNPISNHPKYLGVIQVGLPVGGQGAALATLLNLLLLLGILTIGFSMAAGLFLASRALQPARLAYARQRDFIADASHEIRTPLTMLRSTVEFVLRNRDHLRPDDVALLEDTVLETTHLTQLANNMLDLARLDSETFHVEEEVVDLSDVAVEVGRWSQALARERGIQVLVEAPSPALVLGDGPLLQQAVLVLVDNAIKYNNPGGRVDVSVRETSGEAVISVRDTGIGVGPDHLRRLGERFYRVDKARSRESGGAGLGLSIVRSVIARHNGSFNLTSEPGTGTTAVIRLRVINSDRIGALDDEPEFETEEAVTAQD